jgi:hypothetical protein
LKRGCCTSRRGWAARWREGEAIESEKWSESFVQNVNGELECEWCGISDVMMHLV